MTSNKIGKNLIVGRHFQPDCVSPALTIKKLSQLISWGLLTVRDLHSTFFCVGDPSLERSLRLS